jgi:hypothetical protein
MVQEKINHELEAEGQVSATLADRKRNLVALRESLKKAETDLALAETDYESMRQRLGGDPLTMPDRSYSKKEFLKFLPVVQSSMNRDRVSNWRQTTQARLEHEEAALQQMEDTGSTNKASWPDANYEGYEKIGLEPRFVIIPVDGLRKALGGRSPYAEPLIISSNEINSVSGALIEGGIADHTTARPLKFAKFSGGEFQWLVAGGAEPSFAYHFSDDGVNRGAQSELVAHHPDWVPLSLDLQPYALDDGSLRCEINFATGTAAEHESRSGRHVSSPKAGC